MTAGSGSSTGVLAYATATFYRPLQHLEVPRCRRFSRRRPVPGHVLRPQPHEDVEVAAPGGTGTDARIYGTAKGLGVL